MAKATFESTISAVGCDSYVNNDRGWCYIGMFRSDGHGFALQQSADESEPHIIAGCRYMTIKEANQHYHSNYKASGFGRRRFTVMHKRLCLESRAIISSLLWGAYRERHILKPKWKIEPPPSPAERAARAVERASKKKKAKRGARRG